mmetsp:Transcript_47840/g.84842  ORF Transcript_47840/g.84842 Transcript_47840/m.84842 type:complete len:609 (+) Transcript_47840:149-1975(+)
MCQPEASAAERDSLAAARRCLCWRSRLLDRCHTPAPQVMAASPKLANSAAPLQGGRHCTRERRRMLPLVMLYYTGLLLLLALPLAESLSLPQTSSPQKLRNFTATSPSLGGQSLNSLAYSSLPPDNSTESAVISSNLNSTLWTAFVPTDTHLPSTHLVNLNSHAEIHDENTSSDMITIDINQSAETKARGGIVVAATSADTSSLLDLGSWITPSAVAHDHVPAILLRNVSTGNAAVTHEELPQATAGAEEAAVLSRAKTPAASLMPSAPADQAQLEHQTPGLTVKDELTGSITASSQRLGVSSSSEEEDTLPLELRILLGILGIAVLLVCGVFGIEQALTAKRTSDADASLQVRQWVHSLTVQNADDVRHTFRARSGYDCLLLQPQALGIPARIEGVIAARPNSVLRAPLARRRCVLFSVSASEVRLDGVRAPPVAFSSMNVDFDVELRTSCKAETLRIRVRGQDVALFDISSGWRRERSVLRDAPEHFQDFVRAHRAAGMEVPCDLAVLDFTECLLDTGAMVTCVGELRREHTGELGLWPLSPGVDAFISADDSHISGVLPGLTSWERADVRGARGVEKVMISDDPALLGSSSLSTISHLTCWRGAR